MIAIAQPDYLATMVEQNYDSPTVGDYVELFNNFEKWRKPESGWDVDARDRTFAVSNMLEVLKSHGAGDGSGRALFIERVSEFEGGFDSGYGYRAYSVVQNLNDEGWTPGGFGDTRHDGVLVNAEGWKQAEKLALQVIEDNRQHLDTWPQEPLIVHLWDGAQWQSSVLRDDRASWLHGDAAFEDDYGDVLGANRAWAIRDSKEYDLVMLFLYIHVISQEDKDAQFSGIPNNLAGYLVGIDEFIFCQMGRRYPRGIKKAMEFLNKHLPPLDWDDINCDKP